MGVEIVTNGKHAVLTCNTTMRVFGPVMDDNIAEAFLESLDDDPRRMDDKELADAYHDFCEKVQE